MSDISLRTYAFIDRLQPQCAAHIGATCQGDVPMAGMAELFIEMAPGNKVYRIADIALKAADVRPRCRSSSGSSGCWSCTRPARPRCWPPARPSSPSWASPRPTGCSPVVSTQIITNVRPYQAQLLNKFRKGALLIPGRSLLVIELTPAAYAGLAANEAEKAANIDVVEIRAVGRFGRVFLSGSESEVLTARDAAADALDPGLVL